MWLAFDVHGVEWGWLVYLCFLPKMKGMHGALVGLVGASHKVSLHLLLLAAGYCVLSSGWLEAYVGQSEVPASTTVPFSLFVEYGFGVEGRFVV